MYKIEPAKNNDYGVIKYVNILAVFDTVDCDNGHKFTLVHAFKLNLGQDFFSSSE